MTVEHRAVPGLNDVDIEHKDDEHPPVRVQGLVEPSPPRRRRSTPTFADSRPGRGRPANGTAYARALLSCL